MTRRFETAADAIEFINGARWKGEKNGLKNTRALLDALGKPEERMGKIVHVAGTNGKGSTCAFIESALRSCGYKTGLFTSPYLRRFNERICVNNSPIGDDALIEVASRVRDAAAKLTQEGVYCTTFELLTAAACLYFSECQTDYAVMEVGMGGRLDSTNVLRPCVSVIASIGLDHMQSLGDTIEKIAAEKAGIMKNGVPAIVMRGEEGVMDVFIDKAKEAGARLYIAGEPKDVDERTDGSRFFCELPLSGKTEVQISMAGTHQTGNASLALGALDLIGVNIPLALYGVSMAKWPGRLELRGNVLIDCAHNPQGALTLKKYVDGFFPSRKKILLTGMMRDKQLSECAAIFTTFADKVITTRVDWPRAVDAKELKSYYSEKAQSENDVKKALALARELAGSDGLVIASGSVYLAGEIENILDGEKA